MSEGLLSPRACERVRAVDWTDAASRLTMHGLIRTVLANTDGNVGWTTSSLSRALPRNDRERLGVFVEAEVTLVYAECVRIAEQMNQSGEAS